MSAGQNSNQAGISGLPKNPPPPFWKELKHEWALTKYMNGHDGPRLNTPHLFLRFVCGVTHYHTAPIVCKVVGHRLQSDDWATPESGGMGYHCDRCFRFGARHILY